MYSKLRYTLDLKTKTTDLVFSLADETLNKDVIMYCAFQYSIKKTSVIGFYKQLAFKTRHTNLISKLRKIYNRCNNVTVSTIEKVL